MNLTDFRNELKQIIVEELSKVSSADRSCLEQVAEQVLSYGVGIDVTVYVQSTTGGMILELNGVPLSNEGLEFVQLSGEEATQVLRECELREELRTLHLLAAHLSPTGYSGYQIHPRNIILNMGNFIDLICSGVLTAAGVAGQELVYPFALLALLRSLGKAVTIQLSQDEAACVVALWECQREGIPTTADNIRKRVNSNLKQKGLGRLTKQRVSECLNRLMQIKAVREEAGTFKIAEQIIVRYQR